MGTVACNRSTTKKHKEYIMNLMKMVKGKKTFTVAVLAIVWALWGWYQGTLDPTMAMQTIFASAAALGFRDAMK